MYTYKLEGSNGGYPLNEDKEFDRWFDEIQSYHECCICGEDTHEENLYKTNEGWMCVECFEAITNDPDLSKEDKPILV